MKLKEFLDVTGENQRTIINWCTTGLLVPKIDARGAGSRREFDNSSIRQAGTIRKLVDVGFGRWGVKMIMDTIRDQGGGDDDIDIWISKSINLRVL